MSQDHTYECGGQLEVTVESTNAKGETIGGIVDCNLCGASDTFDGEPGETCKAKYTLPVLIDDVTRKLKFHEEALAHYSSKAYCDEDIADAKTGVEMCTKRLAELEQEEISEAMK